MGVSKLHINCTGDNSMRDSVPEMKERVPCPCPVIRTGFCCPWRVLSAPHPEQLYSRISTLSLSSGVTDHIGSAHTHLGNVWKRFLRIAARKVDDPSQAPLWSDVLRLTQAAAPLLELCDRLDDSAPHPILASSPELRTIVLGGCGLACDRRPQLPSTPAWRPSWSGWKPGSGSYPGLVPAQSPVCPVRRPRTRFFTRPETVPDESSTGGGRMEKKPTIETVLECLMTMESRILHTLDDLEKWISGAAPEKQDTAGRRTELERVGQIEARSEIITEDLMELRARILEIESRTQHKK